MKRTTWHRPATGPETGLSLFLFMYLMGLLAVLLGVHLLQPERENGRSSRTASYQSGLTGTPAASPGVEGLATSLPLAR